MPRKEPSERPATATEVLIELEDLGLTSGSRTSARVLTPSATKEYALPALALSISVLPFVSLSGDPRDDALAEGMSEEIMATLGRQTLLRVTARTSAWRYKGQSADAREIARALHVANVLRGSIEREGDHLRVTALLLDGADAHVRWSTQYSRPMREVFAILDEIASAVADALSVMLLGENPRRPASLEAYEYYLRGRYLWNTQQTDEGLRLAMESFGQALQRDPTYAFAHAGIADTFLMMVAHSDIPRGEGYALAGKAAVEAIRLDPSNAEAHAFLGVVKQSDEWDFAGAEHSLRRSISLNPSYVPATQWLSLLLATVGRGDEAVATAEDVVALDPASSVSLGHAALVQYLARHHDRALKLLDRAERLEPTSPRLRRYRGQVYMATGKIEDAIDAFRAGFADDAGGRISHAFFGMACALTGRTTEARAVLADIEASATSGNADLRAIVLAGLGEKTRALDALEDATARRSLWPAMITADPVFDSLRTEPRFRMLLERILRRRGETDGPGPVAPVA